MYMPHTHTHTQALPYVVALDPFLLQVRPAACVVLLLGLLSSLGERSLRGSRREGGAGLKLVSRVTLTFTVMWHAVAQLLQLN